VRALPSLVLTLIITAGLVRTASADKLLQIPDTISQKSKAAIGLVFQNTPQQEEPKPEDIESWTKLQARIDQKFTAMYAATIQNVYKPTLTPISLGGIEALVITPANWQDDKQLIVYLHGGAYTRFSPMSTLQMSVPVAHDLATKVIAINYSLAPVANYKSITAEVIQAYKSLLAQGYDAKSIAFLGDSAGGGLVASSTVRMSDEGLPLPGALVLWSPWVDLHSKGDTFITLANSDPIINTNEIHNAALAYAPKAEWNHPWASPMFADLPQDYPATLIQCGTREALLSQCVRFYQKLDNGKRNVKLDIYEAMPHVFQGFFFQIDEAVKARLKMKRFLKKALL